MYCDECPKILQKIDKAVTLMSEGNSLKYALSLSGLDYQKIIKKINLYPKLKEANDNYKAQIRKKIYK